MSLEQQLLEERRHTNVILEEIRRDFKAFGQMQAHQGVLLSESSRVLSEIKDTLEAMRRDAAALNSDVAGVDNRMERVEKRCR